MSQFKEFLFVTLMKWIIPSQNIIDALEKMLQTQRTSPTYCYFILLLNFQFQLCM